MPFLAKTYCTKPEQSKPAGVVPPNTYLTPIYCLLVAIMALAFPDGDVIVLDLEGCDCAFLTGVLVLGGEAGTGFVGVLVVLAAGVGVSGTFVSTLAKTAFAA